MVIRSQAVWQHAEGSTTRESKLIMERAKKHRNKKGVFCKGCNKEFARINTPHITKCEKLAQQGITRLQEYKDKYGQASADYLIEIATKTIKKHNKHTTHEQKKEWGSMGWKKTKKLHPNAFSENGKRNAKKLWSRPGQKEKHKKRLIQMNLKNMMYQGQNKLEKFFQSLVNDKNLVFVDHRFWKTIKYNGVTKNITPDFKIKKSNLVVEVFGNYWHKKSEEAQRKRMWAKLGFKCLVIWEKEIRETPQKVIIKYNRFVSRNLHECLTPRTGEDIV